MGADARAIELRRNLLTVEARLAQACAGVGRRRDELTLIAVTKTFPVDDVVRLARLGVRDIGENRDQEAAAKAADLTDAGLRWHFVGQLQVNKCRSVAQYASAVHSVDRLRLVDALARAADAADRVIDVFVQVDLDGEPTRGGAPAAFVPELAGRIASTSRLHLVGVMTVPPLHADARAAFDRLATISADLRREHPEAAAISAGMSRDLEVAVAAGATHVRIGTALLGGRPRVVR